MLHLLVLLHGGHSTELLLLLPQFWLHIHQGGLPRPQLLLAWLLESLRSLRVQLRLLGHLLRLLSDLLLHELRGRRGHHLSLAGCQATRSRKQGFLQLRGLHGVYLSGAGLVHLLRFHLSARIAPSFGEQLLVQEVLRPKEHFQFLFEKFTLLQQVLY